MELLPRLTLLVGAGCALIVAAYLYIPKADVYEANPKPNTTNPVSSTSQTARKPLSPEDQEIYEQSVELIHRANSKSEYLQKASDMLVELAKRNPDSGYPYAGMADLRYVMAVGGNGNYSEALSLAQKAVEIDPGIAHAYAVIAKVLVMKRNSIAAHQNADTAISLAPGKPGPMFAKARAAELTKDYDDAEQWYRKAIDAHTEDVRKSNIYTWLGSMFSDKKPRDIPAAVEAYTKAAELDFDTGARKLSRISNFLLMETDRYDQAIEYAEQALKIVKSDAARYNLGLAEYFKWGDAKHNPDKYKNAPRKPLSLEEIQTQTGVKPEYAFVESGRSSGSPWTAVSLLQAGLIQNVDVVPPGLQTTALISAARGDHLDLVKLLVAEGANINARDKVFGSTAITYAVWRQNLEMVRFLVDKGVRINLVDDRGKPLAEYALKDETSDSAELLDYLLQQGADPTIPNGNGYTLIVEAVLNRDIESVRLLVDKYDADVNASLGDGNTILAISAAGRGSVARDLVELLLEGGANPWVKSGYIDLLTYLADPYVNRENSTYYKESAALIAAARKSVAKPANYDQ